MEIGPYDLVGHLPNYHNSALFAWPVYCHLSIARQNALLNTFGSANYGFFGATSIAETF
jgi:hypothetical protein